MSEPRFIINELHPHSGSWDDQVERQNMETLAAQHNLAIGWKPVTPAASPSPLAEAHIVKSATPAAGPVLVEGEEHDTTEEEVYGESLEKEVHDQAREDRKEDAAAAAKERSHHAKSKKRA